MIKNPFLLSGQAHKCLVLHRIRISYHYEHIFFSRAQMLFHDDVLPRYYDALIYCLSYNHI